MKKNAAVRLLTVSVLLVILFAACFPAASAEANQQNIVTLDMDLRNNMLIARYSVTVYMDQTKLGTLEQGARLIKIQNLSTGIHTVSIRANTSGVTEMTFDIYVNSDMTIVSTLQTQRKYVNVNSMCVTLPNAEFTFREADSSFSDFAQELFWYTIVNCI